MINGIVIVIVSLRMFLCRSRSVIYGVSENLIGKLAICSICGKQKLISNQRTQLRKDRIRLDIYLECKDCASIPLWDSKKVFDHYQ